MCRDALELEEVKTLVLILTLEKDGSFVEDGDYQSLKIMRGSQVVETRLPNETPILLALKTLDEMKEALQE